MNSLEELDKIWHGQHGSPETRKAGNKYETFRLAS